MIHKFIYLLGQTFRNPSLRKNYQFLKTTENWSLEQLEEYQFKKIREIIKLAIENSTFYRDKFAKVNTQEIKSLDDLKLIPVLTKEELIENVNEIHTNIKFRKQFLATTSGTSGQSLKFYRNEEADSFNRAAIQRGYSWHNVNPWDRNGYFWGFNFSFISKIKNKLLDKLQNRFRIFSFEDKSLKSFIKKTKNATYIQGYSSMIYQTAVLINKLNLEKPKNLKLVKGTSEKIFDSYQEEIKKAFGLKMVSEYGATEAGIIGFECDRGSIHINMEGVYVEEVNNEILITNLQLKSFPIIRYKLGDYISLAPRNENCTCGKKHLIIKEITGRVGENIYGIENMYPSLYLYYIFKNISKKENINLNYQVLQEEKGKLVFLIQNQIEAELQQKLCKEIKQHFKDDINFEINTDTELKKSNGKLKNFISTINE